MRMLAGEHDREVQGVVVGAELDKEIEDLVDDLVDSGVRAIALVDDDDGLEPELDRLGKDEAGLGHGALGGVDEQEAAVGHAENALDLAAEIGVARRIDDVDEELLHALPGGSGSDIAHGAVLGENGDAALALQRVGVHDEVVLAAGELFQLAGAKHARLHKEVIDEGGLAMVNVRDDGDVAEELGSFGGGFDGDGHEKGACWLGGEEKAENGGWMTGMLDGTGGAGVGDSGGGDRTPEVWEGG